MKRVFSLLFFTTFVFVNTICFESYLPQDLISREIENETLDSPLLFNKTDTIPEIEWRPIEESLNYPISKKGLTINANGTNIIEYDLTRKIETITTRKSMKSDQEEIETGMVSGRKGLISKLNPSKELLLATIFPPDDRQRITNTDEYPWSSICKLYITADDGSRWIGSGAIIDEFHVLTCGHNVYLHDNGGWASSVEVVPGMDGSYEPFGSAMVTNMRSYTEWTQDEMVEHDWAVLTIDSNMGDNTGWLGRQWASSSHSIYTGTLHTAGYPGDLDNGERIYYTSGDGDSADAYNHWYWLDSAPGQSGSPVWIDDGTNRYIVSINAYSYENETYPNLGTRLNQDKFDQISIWLNEDSANPLPDLRDRGLGYSGFFPDQISLESSALDIYNNIENVGFTSVGAFEVSFYLSTDSTIGINDYLLGTDNIASLDINNYIESTWSGSLPASLSDGNYYVGWIIDPDNDIDEFNENNNKQIIESEKLLVDGTAPSTNIFFTPKSGTNKINKNTKFSLSGLDTYGGSRVNATYYRIDNGIVKEYFEEFTLEQYDLGKHKIYYYSVDNLQNVEELNSVVVIKIDLSDSELALRIGAIMGVVAVEVVLYLFVVKRFLGIKNLTKTTGVKRF